MKASALREAEAQMILSHAEWAIWITFTFKDAVSPETANATLKRWARRMATRIGTHFKIAYVIEGQSRGFPHLHVLAAQPAGMHDGLRPQQVVEDWRVSSQTAGFAKAVYFDPAQAESCARYMTKQGEVDFQVACPRASRCRRSGCVEAPGPWHWRQ